MERRFVCINFERSAISAYVAVARNMPVRVMTLGDPNYDMRAMQFDLAQLNGFRIAPTTFGESPTPELPSPSLYPGGIDDIPA
jgi:hypothetical protein